MRPRNSGSPRRWRISRARLRKLALDLFKQCLVSLIILTHLSSILVAQQIVTDGRTQTSLNTSGTVTDVTTATISGNNAFNSFTKFDVDGGNVVNLHVPNGTNNLLNFVTAERTDIHGTLNAIKDNQIGGNVYFANPHGIVIGAAGVVNVGALNLSTPTQAFVDGAMDGVNAPNAAAASALLDGTAAINGGAVVTVEGTINAVEDIRIQTGAATNSGTIQSGAIYAGSAANFSDIVNTNGYESGTAVVATASGDIVIEAQSSVRSTGTIATNAANAGNISVSAANVTVGGTVSSASETAAGSSGDLELEATGALTINSGTVLKVTEGTPAQPAQEGRLRLAGGTSVSLPANYNLKAGSIEIDTGSTLDLSGTMTAVGGDVSIDAIGWLSIHNDVEAAGDVNLTSSGGSVEIDADITTSGGSIDIDSADGVAVQGTLSSSDEDFDVEDWLASNGNIDIDAAGDVTIDGTLIVTAAEISLADFLALIEDVTLGEMIADLVGNPTVDLPDSITVEGIEIDLPDSMALLDLLDSVADLNLNGILTGYVEGSDVDQLSLNDLRDALGRTTLAEVLDGLGVNGITDVLNDVANSVQEVFRGEDVEVGLALTDVLPEIRFRDYLPSDGNIEIESGGAVTVDGLFSTIDFDEAGHIEVLADGELTVAMGTSFATQNPMLIDDGSYLELVGGEGVEIINATNWAVGALDIESGANLDIHFNVQAIDGDIRLEAAGGLVLTNTGGLTLSVIDSDGGGKAGNIELIAGTAMSMGANNAFLANDANRVDDGGVIVMRNGTMFLPNSLELAYGGLDIETGGSLSIPYDFSAIDGDIRIVTGGDLTLPSGRQIATVDSDGGGSAGSVTLEAGGTLDLGSAVVLDADDVDGNNDGGKVTLYGEAGISLLSDLTLRAHSVDIESAVALNVPLALTAAGGNLRLASGADLTPIFNLTAGDRLELEADGDIALNGIAVSGRDIVATAGGDISVFTDLVAVEGASDLVESRGNIRLTAGGSILIAEVEVQALGGEIVIDAGGDVVVQNTLFADDGTFDLPDWRASNGSITVNAGGTVSIQDNWTATGAEISLADFLGLFDDVRFGDFLESLVGNPTVDLPDKITVLGVEFDTPNSLALLDLLGPAADVTLAEVLTRYVEGTAADQVSVNDLRSALGRTTVADVLDELGVNELTDVLSDVLADIEEALPGIDFDVDVRLTDVLPEIRLRDLLPSDGNIEVYAGGTITVANSKAITVVDDDVSGNIELVAGGALILGSNVDLAARRTAALNSGGAVYLEGEDGVTLPVSLDLLAGDITIISGTGLTVPWGLSAPDGDIELRAKDGDLNIATGATLTTLDDAGGGSGDITLVSGGNIPVSSITFLAEDASLDNDGGKVTMHAGGTLAIPQVSFLLRYGSLDLESGDSLTIPYSLYGLDGDIRIAVDGLLGIANGLTFSSIDSDGGTTAGDLDLYGGQGIAIPSDWTARGRNITIGSGLDLDIPVALYTEDFIGVTVSTTGDLHLYAGDNLFIGGDLTADEGSVTLDAGADVTLTSGKSISAEAVEVSAGNSIVAPNVAIAATKTNIAMTADNDITFSDGGSMTASEGEIDLFAADDIMVGGGMTIHAEDIDIEAGGDISIRSDMTATEGWPSLNGIIEAGHQLDLGDLLDELEEVPLDLIFKASGNVALEADGNIAIEGVTLHADGGNVDIDAGKSISVDGTLIAEAGDVSLADLLLPDGEITLNARDGSITLNGTLRSSPGPLSINSIKNALGDLSLLDLLNLGGNTTIADLEALGFDITGFIVDLDKQISLGLGSYLDY
ncbi:MAG TPA: leukotoxin LktA family filamentous adhesin, partial [Terriglobales bacterium]|nr:leukotoxin LktA family filamentous adhesin [Terriglobales bacterium]